MSTYIRVNICLVNLCDCEIFTNIHFSLVSSSNNVPLVQVPEVTLTTPTSPGWSHAQHAAAKTARLELVD